MSSKEWRETSPLKVLLIISILLYLGTTAFLSITISDMKRTINEESQHIIDLKNQVSSLQAEVNLLRGKLHNVTYQPIQSYSRLYAKVKDSVVSIRGKILEQTILGVVYREVQGSGFVYNYSGEMVIITNSHVVRNVINITVSFLDGDTYPAKVLGEDPYSDLAVLRVEAPPNEFKPLKIVSSASLKVGQPVIAIGNPFGLTGTMTTGVISQLGRTLRETVTGGYVIADIIQISVPINPGNSGGPLLNVFGEVVGITTAIVANSQGVGFAVPSDTIRRELPYLIRGESYPHPWIGVIGVDVTYDIARVLRLNVTYGWLIIKVLPNSPAERAGLKGGNRTIRIDGATLTIGGDIIIAINGTKIRNGDDLSTYLERNTKPNSNILMTIIRNGKKVNVTLTLGRRPPIEQS